MADSEPLRERCAVRLMDALRDTAEKMYADALQAGDDALFDRAEKAINATQQSDFFDTMRRLRLAKPDLAGRALSACKQELDACLRLGRTARQADKPSLDDLCLVDPDTIESDIAINTAAGKSRSKFAREWQQLETRIDGIFAGTTDAESAGRRFGPELFAEAFGKALTHFDCTIEVRLTLLKFMERELVTHSENLIAAAHQALTDCGVAQPASAVPVFRPLRAAASPASGLPAANLAPPGMPAASVAQAPPNAGELDPALGASLQDFLAQLAAPMPAMPQAGGVGLSGGFGPAGAAAPVELGVQDVMRALAALDQKFRSLDRQAPTGGDVATALREQIAQSTGNNGQLRPLDAGVIDLISLMFEYAVNDKHLPGPLQASIARLQIPYLKLALIDPQFLARRDHPARRLLDELSQAAVGWTEAGDRGLRQQIDGIVAALVDGFKDDTAIFERQRDILAAFLQKEGSRTEIAEKRAVQAADGKSKMEAAQRDAAAILKQKLDGAMLPKALSSMVRDRWSNYLVLTLLRHGQDSTAWSEAIRLLELIARFPRADAALDERAEWRSELEDVGPIMRKGLAATGVHDADIDEVFAGLQELLHLPSPDAAVPDALDIPVFAETARSQPPPIPVEPVFIEAPAAEPVPAPTDDLAAELEEVQRLVAGTWIDMEVAPGRRERVKLLWVSADRRNFLFVNANGIKVADRKTRELAEDLKAGRIAILDRKPLVERAFEAAMARVRQFRAESRKG